MMEILYYELGKCPICKKPFNESCNKPYLLGCGNTVCFDCSQVYKMKDIECYFCGPDGKKHTHTNEKMCCNHAFKNMIFNIFNQVKSNMEQSYSARLSLSEESLQRIRLKNPSRKNFERASLKENKEVFDSKLKSKIIDEDERIEIENLIKKNENKTKDIGFTLIYKANRSEYSSVKFHEDCDNYEGTLVLIKGKVKDKEEVRFGGYTGLSWKESPKFGTFIDNSNNPTVVAEFKKKNNKSNTFCFKLGKFETFIYKEEQWAIRCKKTNGPSFYGIFNLPEKGDIPGQSFAKQIFGLNLDYKITNGSELFMLDLIEVYSVK